MKAKTGQESRGRLFVVGAGLAAALVLSSCRGPGGTSRPPGILRLTEPGADGLTLRPVAADTTCSEPNLVIVTHGWLERGRWPAELALAIAGRTDPKKWRCGWYDWHREAWRLRPWETARFARSVAGPHLGEEVLRLSHQYRHVHLIGHSAGAWVINEAARRIAQETNAEIHLTFLDAYVPDFYDEHDLGRPVGTSSGRLWAEQYFTRDFLLHFSDTPLTYAHNVDITKVNPGFNSHKFPIYWYRATVTGRYEHSWRFGGRTPSYRTNDVEYGYVRSLECGAAPWARSLTLPAGRATIQLRPTRPSPAP